MHLSGFGATLALVIVLAIAPVAFLLRPEAYRGEIGSLLWLYLTILGSAFLWIGVAALLTLTGL